MKTKPGMEKEYRKYAEINSQDAYSRACIDVGDMVAFELDEGESGEEALKAMDGHGLTGFMATMIVKAVAHFHPRGDEVAKAWNKDWGAPDLEGGVVNPAVLNISDDGKMLPEIEKV